MKKFLLLVFSFGLLFSHNFWIDYSNPFPEKGEKIEIYIKGGHSFPESEIAVKERLIGKFSVITPSGKEIPLDFSKKDKLISAEFSPQEEGTYIVYFILQKPDGEKFYFAKSYFYVKNKTEIKNLNHELEIVVEKFNFKKDEKINVKFLINGKKTKKTLEYTNKKGHGFIKYRLGKPAVYKVQEGINVIFCEKGGKSCTITFYGH